MRNKPHISFHRVVGPVLALLLFNMALSGILLNHRAITARIPIPRCFLPPSYHVGNWNNKLVEGTLRLAPDSILLYGAAGLFLVDSLWQNPRPFSQGLPPDLAPVNALLKLLTGEVIAATPKGLFTYSDSGRWTLFLSSPEPLISLTYADSVLYALSRSNLYVLPPPYQHLQPVSLPSVEGVSKDVRLFKLIWFLHSGEFFGFLGRLVVDALGVVMMILSVTGIVAMLSRRIGRRLKVRAHRLRHSRRWMRSLKLHTWQGRWLLLPLLLLILTGMMLRPPLLIAIVRYYIAPPAFSPLHSDNPWHDRLRKIAFNPATHTLLLSTSVGFFSAFPHDLQLRPLYPAPPVSVMGCTVLRPQGNGWLVGSFSGLYLWEPQASCIVNAVTREPCVPRRGMPIFSNQTVAGFSTDYASTPLLFDYYRGAVPLVATQQSPHMPSALKNAPISLWHLALELHTGRLYGLNGSVVGESLFIFLLGLLGILLLVTGYRKWRWLAPRKR